MSNDKIMTMTAAAKRLGVSRQSIRRAINGGKLRARRNPLSPSRIGGVYRSDVERYLKAVEAEGRAAAKHARTGK